MMKNNKMNKMGAANSKYNATESAAGHTAADTEFGQEAAGSASASKEAGLSGKNEGTAQKVQKSNNKLT